ncbi:restriction endonuclease [Embleya scabrispora]|uniref:restriction endonuclease n=1 Tax=Embleya scabrispora TaxID=159449 RepID=UPI001F1C95CD|nr:restriction endonuclease [Embleya scabrispora]
MVRDGFGTAHVVGGRDDLGIDVSVTTPDGRTIGFQCKRYLCSQRHVDLAVLQQLVAASRLRGRSGCSTVEGRRVATRPRSGEPAP